MYKEHILEIIKGEEVVVDDYQIIHERSLTGVRSELTIVYHVEHKQETSPLEKANKRIEELEDKVSELSLSVLRMRGY